MNISIGKRTLKEATAFIQELVTDPNIEIDIEVLQEILRKAKAGQPGYDKKAQEMICRLMEIYGLTVKDMTTEEAAWEIYKYGWGLDLVEEIYRMPEVDELRVNNPHQVVYQQRGKSIIAGNIQFKDEKHIEKIIARLIEHDRAILDESNPGCESRRFDGTRITALRPPLVAYPSFVLRKHGTFDISDENYIRGGVMNEYMKKLLSALVRGRANILIAGDTNTGKTTLLRWLFKFMRPSLRVITIETDRELELDRWYPEREIISIEAHPEIGWDMRRCFALTLRLSPNVIIVGEARGLGEAKQMINACKSHQGTMGTIHVSTAEEAVTWLAQMAMEEGVRLPLPILENQVASSFDVIIQMHWSENTGKRRVEQITEVWKGKNGPEFRNLCVWNPSEHDYDLGNWIFPNELSTRLTAKLFKFGVGKSELSDLERLRKDAA